MLHKLMDVVTSTCLFPIINLEPSTALLGLIVLLPTTLSSKSCYIKNIVIFELKNVQCNSYLKNRAFTNNL